MRSNEPYPPMCQRVTDICFLNSDGDIDWEKYAPSSGFVTIQAKKITDYDYVDRYEDRYKEGLGKMFGRYVCPILNDRVFSYEERSLPYREDCVKYFRFRILLKKSSQNETYELNGENYTIPDTIEDPFLKLELDNLNITLAQLLDCYEGEVRAAFNQPGGAVQIKLTVYVHIYIRLGWMEIVKNEII
ncbi:TPA: hypothetical protein ACGO3V_001024 [Streptococcus suis]